jgi:protein required for attachment to host cells
MAIIWVVVAESSRAKLFEVDSPKGPLKEIDDMIHPAAAMHEQKLTSDLPGRGFDGKGGHHKMEEPTPIKEHEQEEFAKQICAKLEEGRLGNKYHKLVIASAPHFLGHLRKCMGTEVQKLVSEEIDKNIVQLKTEEIRKHLPERIM